MIYGAFEAPGEIVFLAGMETQAVGAGGFRPLTVGRVVGVGGGDIRLGRPRRCIEAFLHYGFEALEGIVSEPSGHALGVGVRPLGATAPGAFGHGAVRITGLYNSVEFVEIVGGPLHAVEIGAVEHPGFQKDPGAEVVFDGDLPGDFGSVRDAFSNVGSPARGEMAPGRIGGLGENAGFIDVGVLPSVRMGDAFYASGIRVVRSGWIISGPGAQICGIAGWASGWMQRSTITIRSLLRLTM